MISSHCRRIFSSMVSRSTESEIRVNECLQALLRGGVVAIPTDTVYGIATLIPYVEKLYQIKGRPANKPVALCLSEPLECKNYASIPVPDSLLHDLLPGPVTLVFERSPHLPAFINPNHSLIGFRVPNHDLVRQIVREVESPLALTSANLSGTQSTLSVYEFKDLWPQLDLVLDDGPISSTESSRLGSTVVDLSIPGYFKMIRPGCAVESTVKLLTSSKYNLNEIPS